MKKTLLPLLLLAIMILSSCSNSQSGDASTNDSASRDFLQLATDRYSVRSFADVAVDQKNIDLILKAGQVAPTAVNSQPQKIFVVKSPEMIAKLNEVSPCLYGAPQCFVFCYDDTIANKRGNSNYGDIDVTIVLTHMMLEAENLGIGTCIVGNYDADKLVEALELPSNLHPVLLLPFGYASDISQPSEKHFEYRPIEETVSYK